MREGCCQGQVRLWVLGVVGFLLAGWLGACTADSGGSSEPDFEVEAGPWPVLYWTNSNSAPEFQWTLTAAVADRGVIAPMNAQADCQPWGGFATLSDTVSGAEAAFNAAGIPLEVWMRPRNDGSAPQFSSADDLGQQAETALSQFQACAGNGVEVKGFLCVHEDTDIGPSGVNCDSLQDAFEAGVTLPSGGTAAFGVLGAPGKMTTADVTVAGGELYECPADPNFCYFDPPRCPTDAATYGRAMATWLNANADKAPASGTATPFFGGSSAGCPLEYDGLPAAAEAFRETATPAVLSNLAGLGLWS